jgi:anti-sigma factor RsiW
MSCGRMEGRILEYVDGRLNEGERLEVQKHLESCAVCRLRVHEFSAVSSLLDELPMIEPSPAFDARVHALVAAEPAKKSWWAWTLPSPRVAFAASMLLVATVWLSSHQPGMNVANNPVQLDSPDLPVLENYDVLSNFEPLTELPQPVQAEENSQQQM